jgi:hypothetical protein
MKNQDEFAVQDIVAIQKHIISIRNVHAILDRDLAVMYDVEVKHLNRQVKRNIERFPADFMFQLTKEECIRCQIGTLYERGEKSLNWSTYRPYAFTENGVAMLSGVLRSPIAVAVNIGIMRAFTAMRRFVSDHAGLVQRVGAIELKQLETDKRIDTVFDALDRGNLLPSGILPADSEFDSMRYVSRLIERAQFEILLIDPYSDAATLEVLSKKRPSVKVRLVCKDRGKPTPTEIAKFNRQYKGLAVTYSDDFHDRFLIIDNVELHGLGSSINCLGRRVTSYTTRDPKEIAKLLATIQKI